MGKLALGLPFFIKKDLLHSFVTCAGLEGFESITMAIFKIIINNTQTPRICLLQIWAIIFL